ncbi:LysM peptidoglycan-binding domain-containing protein [Vagococcus zengguangii]|uniref:LysM peptidoglycan-binding domain-containing protein n=1 Tax=Vagococcus zengguangii TaxID=2571750 RepID=A0A4D7CSH8_9ENTE|nr:LysM peptidoglycan-binding domain-containing protein [Vagococcus zengguangii]QCI87245.1 LysM peptidoglycan-binding domain-containing protein [Vagococcus zengguangii]TLG80749.1 LysM peptidoglycan-binding domain-containing protein [Vagococcus zengguangii]
MKFSKLVLGMAGLVTFGLGMNSVDAAEVSHTIKSGETLSTIAQEYFGDASYYNTIAAANNIADANMIFVGETLVFDTEAGFVQAAPVAQVEAIQTVVESQPVQTAPVQETQPAASSYTSNASGSEAEAKSWIAFKESTNNYNARNGQYVGKYQLTDSYLNGDYSPENQERVADNYVSSRYGSWQAAKNFWLANGWY